MLTTECDLTRGGRPVLRLNCDSTSDGLPLFYLSVTGHGTGVDGKKWSRDVFIGLTSEDVQLVRDALEILESEVAVRAAGGV